MAVTDCADAHSAPATVVADLGRSARKMNLPKLRKPSYSPLAWLSIVWAVAAVGYVVLSLDTGPMRMVLSALGAIVRIFGIWLGFKISGVVLTLCFSYSVFTKIAHVIHGDFPAVQLGVALLHVMFVWVIAVWLFREWRNGPKKEKRPNKALVPTPASVTPAAGAPVAPDAGAAHL